MLNTIPSVMNPTTKLAMLRVTPKTVFSTSSMCNNAWLLLDLIQSPRRSCANHMGACVKGLLTQHAAIAMGILTRALTPARAARSIWKGIYQSGQFDQILLRAVEKYDDIMKVMLASLREERQKTYSIFLPIHPETGRVLYVPMKSVDAKNGGMT